MELTQRNINLLLNNYVSFVDEISENNKYSDNIRHLLYIAVPAFIAKYSPMKEPSILKCFSNVKIAINNQDKNTIAVFKRKLRKSGEEYITDKYIAIRSFEISSLSDILDILIHEFNHAVNSVNNEIKIEDKYIKVRDGLTYLKYNKDDLSYVDRSNETVLDELLNTVQTEDIINIIKSFGDFDIENIELANIIHTVCSKLKNKEFESNAYHFQKQVCDVLMNNKTFIPNVNKLRLKGSIEDIPILFDDIIGRPNSYKLLNDLLTEMHKEILKYEESSIMKNKHLKRIGDLVRETTKLIKEYDFKRIFR